jgi:hypothetical protein
MMLQESYAQFSDVLNLTGLITETYSLDLNMKPTRRIKFMFSSKYHNIHDREGQTFINLEITERQKAAANFNGNYRARSTKCRHHRKTKYFKHQVS